MNERPTSIEWNTQYRLEDFATSITFDYDYSPPAPDTQRPTSIQQTDSSWSTTIQDYGTEVVYAYVPRPSFDWSKLEFIRTLNNGSFGSVSVYRNVVTNELV